MHRTGLWIGKDHVLEERDCLGQAFRGRRYRILVLDGHHGRYLLRLAATSAGGTSQRSTTVVVDDTAPQAAFMLPTFGTSIIDGSVLVVANASAVTSSVATVTFYQGNPASGGRKIGTGAYDRATGGYAFLYKYPSTFTGAMHVVVMDRAGNGATASVDGVTLYKIPAGGTSLFHGFLGGSPYTTTGTLPAGMVAPVTVELLYRQASVGPGTVLVPIGQDALVAGETTWSIDWDTDVMLSDGASKFLPVSIDASLDGGVRSFGLAGYFEDDGDPDVAVVQVMASSGNVLVHTYDIAVEGGKEWAPEAIITLAGYTFVASAIAADVDQDDLQEIVIVGKNATCWNIVVVEYQPGVTDAITTRVQRLSGPGGLMPGVSEVTAVAASKNTGELYLGVNDSTSPAILRLHHGHETLLFACQVAGPSSTDLLRVDHPVVGLSVATMTTLPSDASEFLFFGTTMTLGYVADFATKDVRVVDTGIGTITLVDTGELSGDTCTDLVAGIETGSRTNVLACYEQAGDATWKPRIITRLDVVSKFSSIDVGFVTSTDARGDAVLATTDQVSSFHLQESVIEVSIEPGTLGGPASVAQLHEGTLSMRQVGSTSILPAATVAGQERFTTPRDKYVITTANASSSYDVETVGVTNVTTAIDARASHHAAQSFTATKEGLVEASLMVAALDPVDTSGITEAVSITLYHGSIDEKIRVLTKKLDFDQLTRGRDTALGWTTIPLGVLNLVVNDTYILAVSSDWSDEDAMLVFGTNPDQYYHDGHAWWLDEVGTWQPEYSTDLAASFTLGTPVATTTLVPCPVILGSDDASNAYTMVGQSFVATTAHIDSLALGVFHPSWNDDNIQDRLMDQKLRVSLHEFTRGIYSFFPGLLGEPVEQVQVDCAGMNLEPGSESTIDFNVDGLVAGKIYLLVFEVTNPVEAWSVEPLYFHKGVGTWNDDQALFEPVYEAYLEGDDGADLDLIVGFMEVDKQKRICQSLALVRKEILFYSRNVDVFEKCNGNLESSFYWLHEACMLVAIIQYRDTGDSEHFFDIKFEHDVIPYSLGV